MCQIRKVISIFVPLKGNKRILNGLFYPILRLNSPSEIERVCSGICTFGLDIMGGFLLAFLHQPYPFAEHKQAQLFLRGLLGNTCMYTSVRWVHRQMDVLYLLMLYFYINIVYSHLLQSGLLGRLQFYNPMGLSSATIPLISYGSTSISSLMSTFISLDISTNWDIDG